MNILYNILQLFSIFVWLPALVFFFLFSSKYRERIPKRLGLTTSFPPPKHKSTIRIWIHALSVGEVTSAVPLVRALLEYNKNFEIVFTTTTTAGEATARELLPEEVQYILPYPYDFLPVIHNYRKRIAPDMYIHIETDFWLNTLHVLKKEKIPLFLVNGRISDNSFQRFYTLRWLFLPMFSHFTLLFMQTETDKKNLVSLGVPKSKIHCSGNVKYDCSLPASHSEEVTSKTTVSEIISALGHNKKIWVAGSTHSGEEEILLQVHNRIKQSGRQIFLIIAPRDIARRYEIQKIAEKNGLNAILKSKYTAAFSTNSCDLLILDTLGELFNAYQHSQLGFVGGSLVPQGGHNPIEPATCSIPVIFGPHMEDFSEVAAHLVQSGGGIKILNESELFTMVTSLLTNEQLRQETGLSAKMFVQQQQGVTRDIIQKISRVM